MEYFYSAILETNFEEAKNRIKSSLQKEGFGIISEIDMQAKLAEKLGITFKKYTILGACNPSYAYKALLTEEKIGTMLPCNVLVIDKENGTTEIAAVDPIASMSAIENPALESLAQEVRNRLKNAVKSLTYQLT